VASWHGAILLAALGMAADLDFLLGAHRTYSHTLGACVLILLAAMAMTPSSEPRLLTGAACGAAYASHLLLDWLGSDSSVPIGIMALWPFSSQFYESPLHWFLSTERRYWVPQFWSVNLAAAMREIGTLVPLAAAVYWIRRRKV
jgi:inner membrane protein